MSISFNLRRVNKPKYKSSVFPIHATEVYKGSRGITVLILNLGNGSWRSASRPGRFTHGEITPVPFDREAGWAPGLMWTLQELI
jgi:hypothetical protein